MSSYLADLVRNRTGRGLSPTSCAALYALFVATLTASTAFMIRRHGAPPRWPFAYRAALVLLSVGGSMSWWWINGSVEGRELVSLSHNHGLTTGDLLVAPELLFAAWLVALEARPRLRRALV